MQEKFTGGGWWVGGRPNLVYSPGPGLWFLVLGPFGPDLGPGPGPDLDNILCFQRLIKETNEDDSENLDETSQKKKKRSKSAKKKK